MGESLLQLSHVSKTFLREQESLNVLSEMDFTLNQYDEVAIVGASGAGKSTLLHIMGSLDQPTSGTLTYKGSDLFQMDVEALAAWRNRTIGFVFQFHHLLPELNVLENVAVPLMIRGISQKEALAIAEPLLVRLGLKDRLLSRPPTLSGGEQQRTAVARALVTKPEILLADEPTGNLDRRNGEQLMELVRECQRDFKVTLVIVTHNERIAAECQRHLTLIDGQLKES